MHKVGLTLHDFELTKTCDGPPRCRRRHDIVLCEILRDAVGHDSINRSESQAVVTFLTCSEISERLRLIS